MMPQAVEFPDAEDAWQRFLQARLGGTKVGTKQRRETKFVKILRAGGNRRNPILDAPQMIFECYDEDAAKAAKFSAHVRALVHSAEGTEIVPGVFCKRQRDVSGPSDIPDSEHDSVRYSFTVMTELRGQVVSLELEGNHP